MQERDSFSIKLEDTENWLYEDGEDQQKQVYIDKLAELKVIWRHCSHPLYQDTKWCNSNNCFNSMLSTLRNLDNPSWSDTKRLKRDQKHSTNWEN